MILYLHAQIDLYDPRWEHIIMVTQETPAYTYRPYRRPSADEIAIRGARDTQRQALIWLVVSIIQVVIFAYGMALPSVQAELAVHPEEILIALPIVIGALVWICYGYNYTHNRAEEFIEQILRKQRS